MAEYSFKNEVRWGSLHSSLFTTFQSIFFFENHNLLFIKKKDQVAIWKIQPNGKTVK